MIGTRAQRREVQPGNEGECVGCGQPIVYHSPMVLRSPRYQHRTRHQIVCNVYDGDRWTRTDCYHELCWHTAGEPHAPLIIGQEKVLDL